MTEIWKDIDGYGGFYKVSNLGRLFSVKKNSVMGCTTSYKGYIRVCLTLDKKKNYFLHRLVAESFIPNHENKPFVNHKDGNKNNNKAENLEWCTYRENMNHAISTGIFYKSKIEAGVIKLTKSQILDIKESTDRTIVLAKRYNVRWNVIYSIRKGINWKHIQ